MVGPTQLQPTFKEDAVRVIVDHDRCEGNAVCMGIAPDIFDLDDEDYAVVKTDPIPADREDAGRAGDRRMSAGGPEAGRLEVFIN